MATESKQIDGVVDDPENGGLKSGPCLMDSRAASEQELREYESKWKSLEAEYRARSNI